jgi:hypothetical protein
MSEGNPLSSFFVELEELCLKEVCIGGRGLEYWIFDDLIVFQQFLVEFSPGFVAVLLSI